MSKSEKSNEGVVNLSYTPNEENLAQPPPYSPTDAKASNNGIKQNPNFQNPNDGMRPVGSMSAEEIKREKRRIWKNVTIISLSFMCLFTAYNSVANLQSSINNVAGLGTWSQAAVYASLLISCMFIPTWLIKTLKCKWTLVVCQLCYSAYICAQFYPSFETLIPGAIIVGIGAAPMWSAKCTYLTQVGNRYAALIGEKSSEPSITRFFGLFFMFFQTSQIWGNLISSLVLSIDTTNKTSVSDDLLDYCGANFCSNVNLTNITGNNDSGSIIEKPAVELVQLLSGILLGFALLATVVIAIFVDPLTEFGEASRQGSSTGKTGWKLLVATFQHMRNPYQILMIPLTLWSGFEQAFLAADFTAAFITCSWGVENVGYVLICYGAADAVGSITCGAVVKKVGRVPIFLFGATLNLALVIALLLWRPNPSEPAVYFIIAALWGLADSIWQTQINSFYGVIFPAEEEAAFSNYRLWESLGFCIAFAYSSFICVDAKLYVLIGILFFGMSGYLTVEFKERSRSANQNTKQI